MPTQTCFVCSVVVLTGMLSMPLGAEPSGDAAREPVAIEKNPTPGQSDTARDVDQANRLGSSKASARRQARPLLTGDLAKPAQAGVAVRFVETRNRPAESPTRLEQPLKFFPLPAGQVPKRVFVGADPNEPEVVGESERLAYSNTLGRFAASFPANRTISDDLTLMANAGCKLRRFTFQVIGRADPTGVGGPYTVNFVLFDTCPAAGGSIIVGTQGEVVFPDDGPRTIVVVLPEDVELPSSTIWLGVRVNRSNAGVIMGAPALVGFSGDVIDFPRANCSGNFGGFPVQPHASFNAEVYVDAACPEAFPAYRNMNPGRGGVNEGRNVRFADDVELQVDTCDLIGYEIGVRGQAAWSLDIRGDEGGFPGAVIAGTEGIFFTSGENAQTAHLSVDPPVRLTSPRVWVTVKPNARTGKWILVGRDATVGRTDVTYAVENRDTGQWDTVFPDLSVDHGGFFATILCAGQPPVGACCDMYQTDENGDAVCREVPEMNCPFPIRGSSLQPKWVQGATCDPDPFPHPCSQAACCKPDDTCENLTKNECDEVDPVELPRVWRLGRYCEDEFQDCPFNACLRGVGDCVVPHAELGCEYSFCCFPVCDADPFCCQVEWDRQCVSDVALFCNLPPRNDECAADRKDHGALEVAATSITISDGLHATANNNDPGFCCQHDDPGAKGLATVWYKFVATDKIARFSTELSTSPADDSMIQVFAAGDPSSDEAACASLIPIACLDGTVDRPVREADSGIFVDGLVPGQIYYVLVGVTALGSSGHYRFSIESPSFPNIHPRNDRCENAIPVSDGVTRFEFTDATVQCPIEECDTTLLSNLWYDYTATCTGIMTVATCRCDYQAPHSTATIYEGCGCASEAFEPLSCGQFSSQMCCHPEPVTAEVVRGDCYKIRLGADTVSTAPGDLVVDCIECPIGPVDWIDPPSGVVDAGRPHPQVACEPDGSCPRIRDLDGFDTIVVAGPPEAHPSCWSFCETVENYELHPNYCSKLRGNRITAVDWDGNNLYTIQLRRPLTPGELTAITYRDDGGSVAIGRFVVHPGDVNADGTADMHDLAVMIDILRGTIEPPWGLLSADIDRDGVIAPPDLLELIDLLTGTGAYEPWLGSTVPGDSTTCP